MGAIKINGDTSGSTTITAPATGSDESIELSTVLASKLDLAGGKILQIVRATDTTNRTTSSTSFVDASLNVTITPEKSDSAILLIWSAYVSPASNGSVAGYQGQQITDNSNSAISGAEDQIIGLQAVTDSYMNMTMIGYHTPATINATTYKTRFKANSGATARIFNATRTGQFYAIEVSA